MRNLLRFLVPLICLAQNIFAQNLPGELPRQSRSGGFIYRCLFDPMSDAEDSNGFPDYWTRKEGFDGNIPFPAHLNISIAASPNPFSNYVLRMNMEGGAAAVFSPKIPIRAGMSYIFSVYAETNNLVFDEVSLLAAFYGNDTLQPIRTVESKKIRGTNGWQKLVIGPLPADMPNVQSVAIGLLVMPSGRQDYECHVDFTNVEIRESPTISLEMANEHHLFFSARELHVECRFRGLDPEQHSILFRLEDPFGRVIGQREAELMIGNYPAARFVITPQREHEVILGTASWRNMPIRLPGFYRVRVATPPEYIQSLKLPADQVFDDPLEDMEPLTFVVMPPDAYRPGGDFGWSLEGWNCDEITRALPTLAQSGLSHLKLPAWISAETPPEEQDAFLQLCRNLAAQQVRLIGLLQPLPESIAKSMAAKLPQSQINAATVLENDPSLWGETVQSALKNLALLIKDWQWTSDTDTSLLNLFTDSSGQMSESGKERFQQFQQVFDREQFGFGIGFTWNWVQDVPPEPFWNPMTSPHVFLNFLVEPAITPEEAVQFFGEPPNFPVRRSVSVSPLPEDEYKLEDRITNFVKSLVLLKASGLDTISLAGPKNEQTGILQPNGTPKELYLPWRQTAILLSGSKLLGSMTLPNRSQNYCFDQGGGRCVMAIWNEGTPTENPVLETLYLGKEPEIIDVWGKQIVPDQLGNLQTIPVTQTPVFVTGLNIDVAKFRLAMQTNVKTISALPNQTSQIDFTYRNETALPLAIQITPKEPRRGDWTLTPTVHLANLEPGAAGEGRFDLHLEPRANTGRQLFEYGVKISGIDAPEFTVYDELYIGNPDVSMEFVSQITESGDIELIQTFINNSDRAYTYDCRLTVPNRPIQKSRVTRQGFGRAEYVYTIRRGQELLDGGIKEMMLRAVPVNDGSGVMGQPMVFTIPVY